MTYEKKEVDVFSTEGARALGVPVVNSPVVEQPRSVFIFENRRLRFPASEDSLSLVGACFVDFCISLGVLGIAVLLTSANNDGSFTFQNSTVLGIQLTSILLTLIWGFATIFTIDAKSVTIKYRDWKTRLAFTLIWPCLFVLVSLGVVFPWYVVLLSLLAATEIWFWRDNRKYQSTDEKLWSFTLARKAWAFCDMLYCGLLACTLFDVVNWFVGRIPEIEVWFGTNKDSLLHGLQTFGFGVACLVGAVALFYGYIWLNSLKYRGKA